MTDSYYNDDDGSANIFYDAEEPCLTKYTISLVELYNETLHGSDETNVVYHYLLHSRFKILDMTLINENTDYLNNEYLNLHNKTHDIFKNYKNIITRKNYIKPEITECIYLNTGHCVAILKTHWIRLIQKKWKNIIKERKTIIKKRCTVKSLRHREITGKWPDDCLFYPQLQGMLSKLVI